MIDGLPQPSPDDLLGVAGQFGVGEQTLTVFLVVLARVVGMIMTMPVFSNQNIPMTVRVALSVVLAIVAYPLAQDKVLLLHGGEPIGGFMFMFLLINQLLIGMLMGLVAAFVMYGIQSAGRLIDTQRGANLGEIMDPATGAQTSPMGQLMMLMSTGFLVITGLHMVMIEAFVSSFQTLPATTDMSWIIGNDSVARALGQTSNDLLVIAVKVAVPTMLTILMTDVLLGLINRASPTINVFMFSLPMKSVLGLAAILFAMPVLVAYIGSSETPSERANETAFGALLLPGGTIDQLLDCMGGGPECDPANTYPHAPATIDPRPLGESVLAARAGEDAPPSTSIQPRQGAHGEGR